MSAPDTTGLIVGADPAYPAVDTIHLLWGTPLWYGVIPSDGEQGYWSEKRDKELMALQPEVFTDPRYTPAQLLREHSVLLRSKIVTKPRQKPEGVVVSEGFDELWIEPDDGPMRRWFWPPLDAPNEVNDMRII